MHISGVYPRPPAASLRDDSDADDAYDAVLGYPFTISQIQRHLRHSDFVFLVISLFLFRAVVNCKRHFTISMTVVTMVTVFFAYPYPYPINIVATVTIVTKTGKPF